MIAAGLTVFGSFVPPSTRFAIRFADFWKGPANGAPPPMKYLYEPAEY